MCDCGASELNNNSLTSFSARLPATVKIDLSQNNLTSFEVLKASNLATLDLADNQLTQVPKSVFNMSKLSSLYVMLEFIARPELKYLEDI